MYRRIALFFALLVSGCQLQSPAPASPDANESDATPVLRPIPADSLYAIIVAETAAQRKLPAITLQRYQEQATITRDLGIIRRATQIAHLLDASDEALSSARLWHNLEPDNPEPLGVIVGQLLRQGKLQEAFDECLALMAQDSDAPLESLALQAASLEETPRRELLERFEQAELQFPHHARLLMGKALLLHSLKENTQALEAVNASIAIDEKQTSTFLLRARLLEQLQGPRDAGESLKKPLRADPDNARLRLQYARLLSHYNLRGAKKQFQILLESSPTDSDILLSLALVHQELGELDAAQEYLEQLLFLGKHTSRAYYHLGVISESRHETAHAIELYQRVTDGDDYLLAMLALCRLYASEHQLESCQHHLQLERMRWQQTGHPYKDEVSVRLFLIEADLLDQQKLISGELSILNTALEQFPDSVELLYTRAMLYETAGNIGATENDLRKVLDQQPDNFDALNSLGYVLVDKTDRLQEGYEMISRALALDPDNPAIIDSMGWALFRLNRTEEALQYLEKAMDKFPNHEVAAHYGEALWNSGEQRHARKIWRKGLEDDPDSPIIRETMDRLQVK